MMCNQWLTFSLQQEVYALNIMQLKEVLPYREITPIPNYGSCILGVINLRGAIVSVFDIARYLHLSPCLQTADTKILIIEQTNQTIGLLVDNVIEVISVNEQQINIAHNEQNQMIHGLYQHNQQLIIMLDIQDDFA